MIHIDRRRLLQLGMAAAAGTKMLVSPKFAWASKDDASVTIGWPQDVANWDPCTFVPDVQALYMMVYDIAISQEPGLKMIPNIVTKWDLAADATSCAIEVRDDVMFHDGTKFSSEDFAFSFWGKIQGDVPHTDGANVWGNVDKMEILSPTKLIMHFKTPMPTAPQWLAFLGSFIVSKAYYGKVGYPGAQAKAMGTGPYKLVEYQRDSRIVFERNDSYWGPKGPLKRVTVQIIKDAAARIAALESGQVDFTTAIAVRDALRIKNSPTLASDLNPITRVIMVDVNNVNAFTDINVRLAAHHAIDKVALSKAFYGGTAVPLSVVTTPGTPGEIPDYKFSYDPELAKQLLAKSGYSTSKPVKITFATFNGNFPNDYDISRAVAQMWEKVGIKADLQVIEYAQYFELQHNGKLQDAAIYSWDNSVGDPETFIGYMMNAHLPFATFKDPDMAKVVDGLFAEPNYDKRIAGWKAVEKDTVEKGEIIPLLQSIQTVGHKKSLNYVKYGNGWVLPGLMKWS